MADIDLPVFSFRANWENGVTERLSFLTTVLQSSSGAEQRQQVRPTPRRGIEADFLLYGPERAFFDLFANRLGGQEVLIPLYWDIATLTSATVAGTTTRIDFDNTRREFAPGLAILIRDEALTYEVVQIEATDDAGVDLAVATMSAWPVGTLMMPLRRGLIDDMGNVSHKTAGVATVSVQLLLTTANPWEPLEDDSPVYGGLPVFLDEPNWVDDLDVAFDRQTIRLDNNIGLPYQVDLLGRALLGQAHRWFLDGRESLARFRDLIYRHAGRRGSFWLPTFKHDLRLVNGIASTDTEILVSKVGYDYTGGPTSGREYIAIKHAGGTILRKVTSVGAGMAPGTERVHLDSAVGLALSRGQVLRISFADVGRFDQDEFEFTHHGGLDGLSEVSATFRTFKNTRTSPAPISYPIATAIQAPGACGEAVFDPCDPKPPAVGGLELRLWKFSDPGPDPLLINGAQLTGGIGSSIFWGMPSHVPHAGGTVIASPISFGTTYYEANNPTTNPDLQGQVLIQFNEGPPGSWMDAGHSFLYLENLPFGEMNPWSFNVQWQIGTFGITQNNHGSPFSVYGSYFQIQYRWIFPDVPDDLQPDFAPVPILSYSGQIDIPGSPNIFISQGPNNGSFYIPEP